MTALSTQQSNPPLTRRIEQIMLIDDNTFDQQMYARIINRSDLVNSLLQFTDAKEAADYLMTPDVPMPSIVLLDVNMPGMDGFEFLDVVTTALGDAMCPVIVMLTTSLNPSDERRARQFDAVRDFLNKPLTQSLLEHISHLQV